MYAPSLLFKKATKATQTVRNTPSMQKHHSDTLPVFKKPVFRKTIQRLSRKTMQYDCSGSPSIRWFVFHQGRTGRLLEGRTGRLLEGRTGGPRQAPCDEVLNSRLGPPFLRRPGQSDRAGGLHTRPTRPTRPSLLPLSFPSLWRACSGRKSSLLPLLLSFLLHHPGR